VIEVIPSSAVDLERRKRKEAFERELKLERARAAKKAKKTVTKEIKKPEITVPKASKRVLRVSDAIIVADLSKLMAIKSSEVIKKLISMGMMVTINQTIDFDTAAILASEFGFELENSSERIEDILQLQTDKIEDLKERPPIVTIMGHVDHGKTSLLDAIRNTNVVGGEAGGITQHIGAYHVTLASGKVVTFLDTPGHAAFTAMRARGAQITDIVVLVVAADDGVMPQTVEAINHAKEASVPIVVAINKIDKPEKNLERVKRELAEYGLMPEEWGGENLFGEISAKKMVGIQSLLELIMLQAEMMAIKANPSKNAAGYVVEAKLERGRGPVATMLVREGTLRYGDILVAGTAMGKVRLMTDERGLRIDAAGPSIPVEVVGLSDVPEPGEKFYVVEDERTAKAFTELGLKKHKESEAKAATKVTLQSLYQQIQEGEVKELKLVIKADVQGSVEAIRESLNKLSTEAVKVKIIHHGVGGITETDVNFASASNAIIIGFNVRPTGKSKELAEKEGVDIRTYSIIYDLVQDMEKAMTGLLKPTYVESLLGKAEVRQTFNISKVGTIAGCFVTEGKIVRVARIRLVRDAVIVYNGKIASLRHFKDEAKEVLAGFECGIGIENFNDIKINDMIECYELQEVAPKL